MALPSSGQISMSQIRTELGIPSQAPFSLDTAENGGYVAINQNSTSRPSASNPAAMSEWYSYDHSAAGCNAPTINSVTRCSTYAILNISHSNCNSMQVFYSSNGGASWTQEGNEGCVTDKYIYNLSPSTTYLFRARIYCTSTASYSAYSNVANTTTCPANGTFVTSFCSGNALYYRYADGCCGTYDTLISSCDSSCGCSSYDYYYADKYTCPGCTYIETILVAFPAGTSVNVYKYYNFYGGPDGYAYQVTGSASSGVAYILATPGYNQCGFACPSGE